MLIPKEGQGGCVQMLTLACVADSSENKGLILLWAVPLHSGLPSR